MKKRSAETKAVKIPFKLELACFVLEAGARYCEMEMPENVFTKMGLQFPVSPIKLLQNDLKLSQMLPLAKHNKKTKQGTNI